MAFSRKDLEPLMKYPARAESPVLSLYLDVDLSRPANRNRGILVAARRLVQTLRDEPVAGTSHAALDEDARRIESFLGAYEPSGKSLVLFCDASENFLWHRTLPVALIPDARHRPAPYLRPLLETLDEREHFGIALLDRQQARFLSVFMGEIEEHREVFAALDVRATRTTGTDHIFSEKKFQRRADTHAHLHLKRVAEILRARQTVSPFDRLIVAGQVEATSELLRLLPRALADRVAAVWKMPIEAKESDLLRAAMDLEEKREAERETALVTELLETGRAGRNAVLGLDRTLDAVSQGRALRLAYAVADPVEGGRCPGCGVLSRSAGGPCDFCGSTRVLVRDLVARMAAAVADSGGRLDRLHGAAAVRLREADGVGAFLRF